MKKISINDLVNLLSSIKEETPATIVTETVPTMKKTGNPYFDKVKKQGKAEVVLCFSYEKEVNRARALEGKEFDFKQKDLKWGAHIDNSALMTNKGQLYLQCSFKKNLSTNYFLEDKPIDKSLLETWLPVSNSSANSQGLLNDNEVVIRTFKLTSIKEIEVNGENYIII